MDSLDIMAMLRAGDGQAWNEWREKVEAKGERIRKEEGDEGYKRWLSEDSDARLNLSGFDLKDFMIIGYNLQNANLVNANLAGAKTSTANLSHACLVEANLSGATLFEADLSNANL